MNQIVQFLPNLSVGKLLTANKHSSDVAADCLDSRWRANLREALANPGFTDSEAED